MVFESRRHRAQGFSRFAGFATHHKQVQIGMFVVEQFQGFKKKGDVFARE